MIFSILKNINQLFLYYLPFCRAFIAGLFLLISITSPAQTITEPKARTVFQRSNDNKAVIPIQGSCPQGTTRVEARLLARNGQGQSTPWMILDTIPKNGQYKGGLTGTGGWYDLEIRTFTGGQLGGSARLERVGIGEVFIVAGHSVAQGGEFSLPGAKDDRVQQIYQPDSPGYNNTAHPDSLRNPPYSRYGDDAIPGPFGFNTYFWGVFGDSVVHRLNVPVLIFNAAFGGTNLEHWAKSAQMLPFEHSFVNAKIGMPYVNVKNALLKYVKTTGIRGVLCDHGQNDHSNHDAAQLLSYYQTWVEQARNDLGYADLAFVINRQTPGLNLPNPSGWIRQVQEQMALKPNCFPGPDYDKDLTALMRPDGIHPNIAGQTRMAQLWADAISSTFLNASKPWLPLYPNTAKAIQKQTGHVTNIRFFPAPDSRPANHIGGRFEASNDAQNWTLLTTISEAPATGWNNYQATIYQSFRYVRYLAPEKSWGNVAEVEFYSNDSRLTGRSFGTPGSLNNQGTTFRNALDKDTTTYFEGPAPSENFVGIDTHLEEEIITAIETLPNWALSPNPAHDIVSIRVPAASRNISKDNVRLCTASGKNVFVPVDIDSDTIRLQISKLPSGVYIVTVLTEAGKRSFRFVKSS